MEIVDNHHTAMPLRESTEPFAVSGRTGTQESDRRSLCSSYLLLSKLLDSFLHRRGLADARRPLDDHAAPRLNKCQLQGLEDGRRHKGHCGQPRTLEDLIQAVARGR